MVLLLASFWSSLSFPFLSDDFVHLKLAHSFHRSSLVGLLTSPGGDGFFRPVGYIFLAAVAPWAEYDPVRWRLVSLALHAANCLLLYRLAVRLGWRNRVALLAGAVFGLHGSRPEAVVWTSGVFDVLATLFSLSSLSLFLCHQRTGGAVRFGASLVLMVAALLTKEVAFVFPLLAVLVLALDGRLCAGRLRPAIPFVVVAAAVFAYRWHLLNGIGGYLDSHTGKPQVLTFGVLSAAKVFLLRLWGPLYFPINWSAEPRAWLVGMTLLGLLAHLGLTRARADRRRMGFALGFLAVSAVPACHQLLISSDLEKSRLLYLPSVGFSLLVAAAVQGLSAGLIRVGLAAGLLAFYSATLHHNLGIWGHVASLADHTCRVVSAALTPSVSQIVVENLPGSLDGVYLFRNGFRECIELRSGRPVDVLEIAVPAVHRQLEATSLVFRWDACRRRLVPVE